MKIANTVTCKPGELCLGVRYIDIGHFRGGIIFWLAGCKIKTYISRGTIKCFHSHVIRDAEKITGFDFFTSLPKYQQDKLETELDLSKWELHEPATKYRMEDTAAHVEEPAVHPEAQSEKPAPPAREPSKSSMRIDTRVVRSVLIVVALIIIVFAGIGAKKRRR